MAVGESPNAAPSLQSAERPGQDAAHRAKPARPGIIVFGDRKGFVVKPGKSQIAPARRAFLNGAGIARFARQAPRVFYELRVVDVKMVINIVINCAGALVG